MSIDAETVAEIRASLVRMGLLAAGEAPEVVPLSGGVSSLIVRVETSRGPLCYKRALARLRVAKEWHAPVERARAEAGYLRVAKAILPDHVPTLLGWDEEALALALEWLPPERHRLWKTELLEGRVDVDFAANVGACLARLHDATSNRSDLAREFGHDAQFDALRLDPYLRATANVHPGLASRFEALIATTRENRRVLVHGDVSPKNILMGPRGPVFLDAETAWYGDPAFDVAFCANHLLLKAIARPLVRDACFASFDAFAEAYFAGARAEPRAVLERRAAALLPGLFLARVDGKSPVEYLTDERDKERVRRVAIPLLATPVATLGDVRARLVEELAR